MIQQNSAKFEITNDFINARRFTTDQLQKYLAPFKLPDYLYKFCWKIAGLWLDESKDGCFLSRKRFMELMKCSETTVKNYIRALKKLGIISVFTRTRENGSQTSNLYVFNIISSKKFDDDLPPQLPPHKQPLNKKNATRQSPRKAKGVSPSRSDAPKNICSAKPFAGSARVVAAASSTPSKSSFKIAMAKIQSSSAHDSIKELAMEKLMRAYETGHDRKGNAIGNLVGYALGIIKNLVRNPYQRQLDHFARMGMAIDIANGEH